MCKFDNRMRAKLGHRPEQGDWVVIENRNKYNPFTKDNGRRNPTPFIKTEPYAIKRAGGRKGPILEINWGGGRGEVPCMREEPGGGDPLGNATYFIFSVGFFFHFRLRLF